MNRVNAMIPCHPQVRAFGRRTGNRASTYGREDHNIGLDLDRIVWDPEYRREIIERLASLASDSGTADKPG